MVNLYSIQSTINSFNTLFLYIVKFTYKENTKNLMEMPEN